MTVKDNDGLTNTTNTTAFIEQDSDGDGWSDQEEQQYGTDPSNSSSMPKDTDNDHLPDTVDPDDDNDGLPDDVETVVGSDPKNKTSFATINISRVTIYLVDTNNDEVYDSFYNTETGVTVSVSRNKDGSYLIDEDGDGNVDYIYDPASGVIKPYEKPTQPFKVPWMLILVIALALVAIAVITYLYREGYI